MKEQDEERGKGDRFQLAAAWQPRMVAVPALLTVLLAGAFVEQARKDSESVHAAARNSSFVRDG